MTTTSDINIACITINNASSLLVKAIDAMRKLSSSAYSTERDQIILQIGRLSILSDRISKEHPAKADGKAWK